MEVNAVDTNIVVRFLTHDDPDQFKQADAIFNSSIAFIPDTVWLETEWVLRFAYDYDAKAVVKAFRGLLGLPQVRVRDANRLHRAIEWHSDGLDFADALHLACSQGVGKMVTFDKAFARKSANRGTCRVVSLGI